MNTAYHDYLTDALDHYLCNTDDDAAIHRFLDWLDAYDPDHESMGEPDLYTYGDAQDQYALAYIDADTLRDHGVPDPTPDLIRRTAEIQWDLIAGEDRDWIGEALEDPRNNLQ